MIVFIFISNTCTVPWFWRVNLFLQRWDDQMRCHDQMKYLTLFVVLIILFFFCVGPLQRHIKFSSCLWQLMNCKNNELKTAQEQDNSYLLYPTGMFCAVLWMSILCLKNKIHTFYSDHVTWLYYWLKIIHMEFFLQ